MSGQRKRFSRDFKLQVARAYESGVSIAELARRFEIHSNIIYRWSRQYRNDPQGAFQGSGNNTEVAKEAEHKIVDLERMIGRLTVENDFLKRALQHAKNVLAESNGKTTKS
jgi:transposase